MFPEDGDATATPEVKVTRRGAAWFEERARVGLNPEFFSGSDAVVPVQRLPKGSNNSNHNPVCDSDVDSEVDTILGQLV